jgi:broad specificity phosphatase PhoE
MQAEKLGLAMKDVPLTAVYSSPLRRAMDTAGALAKHHGLTVIPDAELREIHVGEMEGMSLDTFGQNFSQFLVEWQTKGDAVDFKGGENLGQFRDRVWAAIRKIVNVNRDGTVAVVSTISLPLRLFAPRGLPITHLVRVRIPQQ